MSRLPTLLAAIASVSIIATLPAPTLAQDAADLEMSEFKFTGKVVADNVYVRSGASENDYPVLTLAKGSTVTVVGAKYDWLKILPPQGAFCLVGKPWVDRRGDGSVGRVREDSANVNVRIGSNLNNMLTKVAVQLKGGDDVKIIGDADGYFKIEPPPGTFLYVHKKFVEPGERVNVVSNNGAVEVKPVAPTGETATAQTPTGVPSKPAEPVLPPSNPAGATPTDPIAIAAETAATIEPGAATQPVAATDAKTAAAAAFDTLEQRFNEASTLPIEQQPIDDLIAGYDAVLAEKKAPESMLRIAEYRAKGLKIRKTARDDYLAVRQMQAANAPKAKALQAEDQEIAQRLEQNRIKAFTAVGTLRPSALTMGGRTLYRLTDPSTGRTVVYLNTSDPSVISNEGQFVGVRGTVTDDPTRQIKFLQPTDIQQIDVNAILKGDISSTLMPPSLLPVTAIREH